MLDSVRRAAQARASKEAADARLLIMTGVPFAFAGWLGLTGALWLLQLLSWSMLPWSLAMAFWLAAGIATTAIIVDCIRHPNEEWRRGRYFQVDGSMQAGDDMVYGGLADGAFDGMPMMSSVADPGNLAERGRVIGSGCSNIVLAGPRNIRQGIAKLANARRRTDKRLLEVTSAFVESVSRKGDVSLGDAEGMVRANRGWAAAALHAIDLGLVRKVRGAGGEQVLRAQLPPPDPTCGVH